ncbi:MAG: hypothetical protein R6V76_06030 [Desulfobacterales bacterium]
MSEYGYAFIPHEIYYETSITTPDRLQKILQADTVKGFVTVYPWGLFGFNGCGYAAVDGGFGWIHAECMRAHTRHENS